jgi:hypothetical protein
MTEQYIYAFTNRDDDKREFTTDVLLNDDQIKRIAQIISEDNGDEVVTSASAVMKIEYIGNEEKRTWL